MEKYVDQCPSKLKYYFLHGMLNMEQFTLYKSGELLTNYITLNGYIIGESDAVSLQFQSSSYAVTLTEAVICHEDVNLGECKIIHAGNFSASGKLFAVQTKFFHYKLSGKIYDWDSGLKFLNIMERLVNFKRDSHILGLSKNFEAGIDGIIPKTIVFAKVRNKKIVIYTIHTYPPKNKIAFSNSTITFLRG